MMLRTPPPPKRPGNSFPVDPLALASLSPSPSPSKRPRLLDPDPHPPHRHIVPFGSLPPAPQDLLLLSDLHGSSLIDDYDDGESTDWDSLRCSYKCRQMVKSELLETLDSQEKKMKELESTVRSLQNVTDVAESEKKELLGRVNGLEQEVAASSAREKSVHEKFMLEMERAEERLRTQFKRCNDLEMKLQLEMRQRAEAEVKANAAERQLESLKEMTERATEDFKREIRLLNDKLQRLQKDSDLKISRTKAENSVGKGRVQFAEADSRALKAQCEDLQKQLAESMDAKRELERKLAMATPHISTSENHEAETIARHLRDELKHCEADVAEARKLKQFHVNADLLKEKLESERQRADRAEAALGDLADLQLQVKCLEGELQAWRNLIHELPDIESRDDIPRKIADLQREAMSAMARVGDTAAQVTELEVALEKAENARSQADKKASLLIDEVAEMKINIKRLERKVQLLTKEKDGLKAILASYDEEEAVIVKQNKPGDTMPVLATPEKSKEKRIQELEALIVELQNEGDVLRSELTKLEMKLGRGDYDPSSTKVVRMVENLDVDSGKQVLQLEIQSLREKLEVLQNKNFSSGLMDNSNTELSLLREQVTSLEKRETRYKKVFAEKISVFRQACCLLFGYKVQMNEEQQLSTGMTITLLTLQSIYAEDEKLEFQYESGHMNLLANDYTSSPEVARMVDVYLQKFKSIPAFTANLTAELFNKTTMG